MNSISSLVRTSLFHLLCSLMFLCWRNLAGCFLSIPTFCPGCCCSRADFVGEHILLFAQMNCGLLSTQHSIVEKKKIQGFSREVEIMVSKLMLTHKMSIITLYLSVIFSGFEMVISHCSFFSISGHCAACLESQKYSRWTTNTTHAVRSLIFSIWFALNGGLLCLHLHCPFNRLPQQSCSGN